MSRQDEMNQRLVQETKQETDHETPYPEMNIMEMVNTFGEVVGMLKKNLLTNGFIEEDHQVQLIQTFFDSWIR